jgi:hypothetical protein
MSVQKLEEGQTPPQQEILADEALWPGRRITGWD